MERTVKCLGRVVFFGAVHEALPALHALQRPDVEVAAVVTPPSARARALSGYVDLEPVAVENRIPVVRTPDANDPRTVDLLARLAPDLIVAVGWTRLLGDALLAIPRRGCVGFHASLLPRHRGRAPVNWAILRGETLTGNTMMFLAPGADEGDIVDQRPVPIGAEDTCATVYARVAEAGAQMLTAHLPGLLTGTAPRRRQQHDTADLLPRRTPEMGITDWNRPANEIHDWIRALTSPYPGAFSTLAGRTVRFWRSLPPTSAEPLASPGTVVGVEGDAVRIGALDGSILVTDVSVDDGRPEAAALWFSRTGIRPGTRFDPVDAAVARWARGLGPRPDLVGVPR
jgi:methionyl-tRNA formyltransferase